MKKIVFIGLILLCSLAFNSLCAEVNITESRETAKPVQYLVKVSIQYNAVDQEHAQKLVEEILSNHKSACEVHVDIDRGNTLDIANIDLTNATIDTGTLSELLRLRENN